MEPGSRCTLCPGAKEIAVNNGTKCTNCHHGTEPSLQRDRCTKCPAGSISDGGKCQKCSTGTDSDPTRVYCKPSTLISRRHVVCVTKVGQSMVNASIGDDPIWKIWGTHNRELFNDTWLKSARRRVEHFLESFSGVVSFGIKAHEREPISQSARHDFRSIPNQGPGWWNSVCTRARANHTIATHRRKEIRDVTNFRASTVPATTPALACVLKATSSASK